MSTLAEPTTTAEQDEANFGEHAIWRLVNSTIIAFGASEKGEIFLSTRKRDQVAEFLIGVDERGDVALYEVEKEPTVAENEVAP